MSSRGNIESFQKLVWDYYHAAGRHDLPWRLPEPNGSFDPYKILVSEMMLQQTQVARVIPKFSEFITKFPTVQALGKAPLREVLIVWSGLGYNRRAKFLHHSAQIIVGDFGGSIPRTSKELVTLPGIGINTAGAVLAYAFNEPVNFLETNIRTAYIYHFFKDQTAVSDTAILKRVAQTLDSTHPRVWYWALMDYGSFLKKSVGNNVKASKSYVRQSSFAGSRRQLRGQLLRLLTIGPQSGVGLSRTISDERLADVLAELTREGLIHEVDSTYRLGA